MSLLREFLNEINLFAQTFLGFLGFILWAWTGRIISDFHHSQTNPFQRFRWTSIITEIPIAVGLGIVLGGMTEYLVTKGYIEDESLIQPAIIAMGAYLGPKLITDLWKAWVRSYTGGTTKININTNDGVVEKEIGKHGEVKDSDEPDVSDEKIVDAIKNYIKDEVKKQSNNEDKKRDTNEDS